MIRKYLIFGKQVFISSAKFEIQTDEAVPSPIELRLPIEIFWESEKLVKKAEFLQSMNEDANRIKDAYKELLVLVTPYAVLEKDRLWLLENAK